MIPKSGNVISRRSALKTCLAILGSEILFMAGANLSKSLSVKNLSEENRYGLLIVPSRCIGCGLCVKACMESHGQSFPYTRILKVEAHDLNLPLLCMHCSDPPCVKVCLSGALSKTNSGAVILNREKCIGCSLCSSICPFGRIIYDSSVHKAFKCDMCIGRISEGRVPACVEVCPVSPKARLFGPYEEILNEAFEVANEINGLVIYPRDTSVIYVVKREWFEDLSRDPVKLTEKYPAEQKMLADIIGYSRFTIPPFLAALLGYAFLRGRE